MPPISLDQEYVKKLIKISKRAGDAIMDIYESEFDVNFKSDQSPLTKADILSNKIICQSLEKITPDVPILSEESSDIPYHERSKWNQYWLIDPLDGTKEFIKRNNEFTVNIALIRNNRPVFGVIHAPALDQTFWGSKSFGSFMMNKDGIVNKIYTKTKDADVIRVVSSRSHKSERDLLFLDAIGKFENSAVGSSLKLCYLANGSADIYPRYGRTSEWDIAAGDAILSFAGGIILGADRKIIQYNIRESLINDSFIACGSLNEEIGGVCSKFYELTD